MPGRECFFSNPGATWGGEEEGSGKHEGQRPGPRPRPQHSQLPSLLKKTNQSTVFLLSFLFPEHAQSPSSALGYGTKVVRSKLLAPRSLAKSKSYQGFFPTPSPETNLGHSPLPLGEPDSRVGGGGNRLQPPHLSPQSEEGSCWRLPRWESCLGSSWRQEDPDSCLPSPVSCGKAAGTGPARTHPHQNPCSSPATGPAL